MRRLVPLALLTAAVTGAPLVGGVPALAAPTCVDASDTRSYGSGEITACYENGTGRLTGHIVDLLPGSGWGAPDGYCVGWYVRWTTTSGQSTQATPFICGQWTDPDETTFDVASPAGVYVTGVASFHLQIVSI